ADARGSRRGRRARRPAPHRALCVRAGGGPPAGAPHRQPRRRAAFLHWTFTGSAPGAPVSFAAVSKRKLEATRANQARKVAQAKRTPPGYTGPSQTRFGVRRGPLVGAVGAVGVLIAVAPYPPVGRNPSNQASASPAVNWNSLQGLQPGPPP